jgi:hypothetical protein
LRIDIEVSTRAHTTWFGNLVSYAMSASQQQFTHHMVRKLSLFKKCQHVSSFSHIYIVWIWRIDNKVITHAHTTWFRNLVSYAMSASQQQFTHHMVWKLGLFNQSQHVSSFSHNTWFVNLACLRNVSMSAAFHTYT